MTIAFLNIGTQEMILIVIVILLLFGGKKLPELARGLGKGIREFKDASEGIKREISDQINNFEKDLDVTVEDTPNRPVAEKVDADNTANNVQSVEEEKTSEVKKFPGFTTPENTVEHHAGEHPVDDSSYYKYGYSDHFAESETPSSEVKDDKDSSPENKQA